MGKSIVMDETPLSIFDYLTLFFTFVIDQFPYIVDFQHHCALLTMSSSIFGAEQRISEPLSALAVLTGRHREEKHPRPNFSQ